MRQTITVLVAVAFVLSACGKKESAAPAANPDSQQANVSVDALAAGQTAATPPPPPTPAAAVTDAQAPEPAPAAEAPPANWFAHKTAGEKAEIMEGWLHQYQIASAADKAEILKQVANSKLTAADKAMLEQLRTRFKYPPLPVK
jgi:hypothetical protein